MFVPNSQVDTSSFKLLEDVSDLDYNQIMKYYFGDVDVKTRNNFLNFLIHKGVKNNDELNVEAHKLLLEIKEKEAEQLPDLIYAIITSTLAFEANDELSKTLYKDYKDKNIAKNAKPFINGLYKIYRNNYEQLFNVKEDKVLKISKDLSDCVEALANTKLSAKEILKRLKD